MRVFVAEKSERPGDMLCYATWEEMGRWLEQEAYCLMDDEEGQITITTQEMSPEDYKALPRWDEL